MTGPQPPGALLEFWVVYKQPEDYPSSFVVRRQWPMQDGQVLAEFTPRAVVPTLEEARSIIPHHLTRLERMPGDVPSLVECWI